MSNPFLPSPFMLFIVIINAAYFASFRTINKPPIIVNLATTVLILATQRLLRRYCRQI